MLSHRAQSSHLHPPLSGLARCPCASVPPRLKSTRRDSDIRFSNTGCFVVAAPEGSTMSRRYDGHDPGGVGGSPPAGYHGQFALHLSSELRRSKRLNLRNLILEQKDCSCLRLGWAFRELIQLQKSSPAASKYFANHRWKFSCASTSSTSRPTI